MSPNVRKQGLSRRQELAIDCEMLGKSKAATARELGLSEKTLYRWGANPEYCRAIASRRAEQQANIAQQLVNRAIDAVQSLSDTMSDPSAPHAARVSAAAKILDLTMRFRCQSGPSSEGFSGSTERTVRIVDDVSSQSTIVEPRESDEDER